MIDECETEIQRLNDKNESFISVPSLKEPDPYVELRVGKKLEHFIKQSTSFQEHIGLLHEQFENKTGVMIPALSINHSDFLDEFSYQIYIKGTCMLEATLLENKLLAVRTPLVLEPVKGEKADETLFGSGALWITEKEKEETESLGYFILDLDSILLHHLESVLDNYLHLFIDRTFVLSLFDECDYNWASQSELEHLGIRPYVVQQVIQELIKQRVAIHNISNLFEYMIQYRTEQHVEQFPVYEVARYIKQKIGNK
jgi:flagellar biosynthesis component FlhA